MGEVYRAKDSKLKREVAIKVLPLDVAGDPERLSRFQREAEVLASLSHPGIAHVYGIEDRALVMELVDGEDLADQIRRGPIAIDEALPIARQIAEAVEAAHDAGIIHRDLKPANIKVRGDGSVKVLDFGLAKALDPAAASRASGSGRDLANSPTITTPAMTMRGAILGTAAYMSPEQAKGRAVDKRADVWAFGCVLYEMLAGKQAFAGEDVTDTLTAVLRDTPDWNALPAATPAPIRTLLRRCIEKDPRKRTPHMAMARIEIDDVLSGGGNHLAAGPSPQSTLRRRRSRTPEWVLIAAIGLLVAAATGYWAGARRSVNQSAVPYRSAIVIDENLNPRAPSQRFAISPDGRKFVYAAVSGGEARPRLLLRNLDDTTSHPLAGTEGALGPFWSPDSRFVAFFSAAELKKVDITSRVPAVTIAANAVPDTGGATGPAATVLGMPGSWNQDNVIIYGAGGGLMRVPASGGTPEPLTALGANETTHDFPSFLPDGRHFVYAAYDSLAPAGLYVGSLDGSPPVRLMDDSSNAVYANGLLVFMRGPTLMVQPFDPERRTLAGEARPLVSAVLPNITARPGAAFSVSQSGAMVYQSTTGSAGTRLVFSTRDGVHTPIAEEEAPYRDMKLSKDGTRLLFSPLDERGRSDIWIVNLTRGARSRLTFTGTAQTATWSHDGRSIVFNGGLNRPGLIQKSVDGSGAERAVGGGDKEARLPSDVSADGRMLLYESFLPSTSNNIWAMPLDGTGEPIPVAVTRFSERWAQFSPDGRWVAYTSDESGPREIYVTRFRGEGRWQVSSAGGSYPRWSSDGRELYFYTPNNKISAVRIAASGDALEVGPVTPLFDARPPSGFGRYFYDVAPDGRFLLTVPTSTNTSTMVTLFVNWPATVQR